MTNWPHLPTEPLGNAVIVSIDPAKLSANDIFSTYGQIIAVLGQSKVRRIIITEPPELADDELPGWAAAMNAIVPVYAPTRHRFADLATRDGFVSIVPDSDGVLRRARLVAAERRA